MIIVECTRCGDRYRADVAASAVERIARCRNCGRAALVVVEPPPGDGTQQEVTR
jgi:DNA-directed RNA polymerase subunit RPC12/RpoP